MKKHLLKISSLLLVLCLLVPMILTSCKGNDNPGTTDAKPGASENSPSKPDVPESSGFEFRSAEGISVVMNGDCIDVYVSNSTTVFQFNKYVKVANGITWTLANDISLQEVIPTKAVSLSEGKNIYYIFCTNASGTVNEIYTVTIHRSGSFAVTFEGITDVQSIADGKLASIPAAVPKKEGYTFDGWNFDFNTPIIANTVIYAKWKANTYTITYDAALGTVPNRTQTVTYGEEVNLAIPKRDGFVFANWYMGETCVKSGVWTIASNVILTAHWANDSYTITFNPDDGKMDGPSVIEVTYGEEVKFPIPVKDGFTFGGWYDGDTLCFDGVFEYTKDLNLVAKWNMQAVTITFIENGGKKGSYSETIPFGGVLPIPEREGFTFGGWFSDEALTKEVKVAPEESLRLYAWWQEELKPTELVYKDSGISYKVIDRVDRYSDKAVPAYIGGRKTIDESPKANPNAGITLETDRINVKVDRNGQIIATLIPHYEDRDNVLSFESSAPQFATVDPKTGVVTGVAPGACVIYVRTKYFEKMCIIIVEETKKNPEATLTVDPYTATLQEGKELTLNVKYVPEYKDDSLELTYASSAPEIATVDKTGVVKAVKEGNANITITDAYGKTAMLVLKVTKEPVPVPGITLDQKDISFTKIGDQITVKATFVPEKEGDSLVLTWTTDNDKVATVENGVITAKGNGSCKITVESENKKFKAEITVKVEAKDEKTAEEKVQAEEQSLTFQELIDSEQVITLPLLGTTYKDVVISWASESKNLTIKEGSLTVTLPEEGEVKAELVATLTLGEVNKVKKFTVTLKKNVPAPDVPDATMITIEPYGDPKNGGSWENWSDSGQTEFLLVVHSNKYIDNIYDWKITFDEGVTTKTVTLKSTSNSDFGALGGDFGPDKYPDGVVLYRFEPCIAKGENQFIPKAGTEYTVTVEIYKNTELVAKSKPTEGFGMRSDFAPIVPKA